ncbi:hypothetical protein MKQ70_09670 [Chitinophaga sedimenti]|uniref:hypothetical protein n=1 Tax=Chitinophaga sedimenti TaxID=2033606 RepID=UPI0020035C4B|nr:hypothetical protein [Chitinophaga sedimenti]MCK7555257.1 hypothetical protein [Chitinophaga sedimenti]
MLVATKASAERTMFSMPNTNAEKALDKKRAAVIRSLVQDLFIHLAPPAEIGRYMAYECKPDCSACFCKRVEFVREETGAFLRAYHSGRVSVQPYAAISALQDCAAFALPSQEEIYGIVSGNAVMMYFLFEVNSEKLVSFCTEQQGKYLFAL